MVHTNQKNMMVQFLAMKFHLWRCHRTNLIAVTAEAQQLRTINPLQDSVVYGVDIYAEGFQILS